MTGCNSDDVSCEFNEQFGGGCVCGRVRFTCSRPPFRVSYCHCADCRHVTGAPVSVFVGWKTADVHFEGTPIERQSSAQACRLSCGTCGTPFGYRDERLPEELYLLAGTLDAPEKLHPQCHAWTEEALPWLVIDDELPRYPRFSRSRD